MVKPEPSVPLSLHNQVIGHNFKREIICGNAEALVRISRRCPSRRPHGTVYAVYGTYRSRGLLEKFLARPGIRRGKIKQLLVACGKD